MLPKDPKARKAIPLFRGLFQYFPDALAAVAEVSRVGNEQHNPGQPMHWAKEKSTDEPDALLRHMLDLACEPSGVDTDGLRHSAKIAWRALALLQRELEAVAGDIQAASWAARKVTPDAAAYVCCETCDNWGGCRECGAGGSR